VTIFKGGRLSRTGKRSGLGRSFCRLVDYLLHAGRAEALVRRALAIDERNLGTQHPSVAADLKPLGMLLQGTNRLAEAEPLLRRALAIDNTPALSPVVREQAGCCATLAALARTATGHPSVGRGLGRSLRSRSPLQPALSHRARGACLRASDSQWRVHT
jgi:hypothetical protein